ncbi:MAG: 50S ribosomal protein L25 [Chloroflexota bacterium]
MSQELVLEAETRKIEGKKVKQLRRDGKVPAVIYGLGDPESIQLDTLKTTLMLRDAGDNDILTLKLNGQDRRVLALEIQRHVYKRDLLHVDFLEVNSESVVTAVAVLKLVGRSIPEQRGLGTTLLVINTIDIEGRPDDLVSEIEVNGEIIDKPSRNLLVSDIVAPEGVKITTTPGLTVARFAPNRQAADQEDEIEEEGGVLDSSAADE